MIHKIENRMSVFLTACIYGTETSMHTATMADTTVLVYKIILRRFQGYRLFTSFYAPVDVDATSTFTAAKTDGGDFSIHFLRNKYRCIASAVMMLA